MKAVKFYIFIFIFLIMAPTTTSWAKIYQWVDSDGVRRFSDTPPPEQVQEVTPTGNLSNGVQLTSRHSATDAHSIQSRIFQTNEPFKKLAHLARGNFFSSHYGDLGESIISCWPDKFARRLSEKPSLLKSYRPARWTLLNLAIASACKGVVLQLIQRGADVNELNFVGKFSPLHLAALSGQTGIMDALIANGADLNANPQRNGKSPWYTRMPGTPLHTAFHNREYEALSLLLRHGADPKATYFGRTLLEYAADQGRRAEIAQILHQSGLPVANTRFTVEKINAAIRDYRPHGTKGWGKKSELVFKWISDQPELIHMRDKNGDTPLHWAVWSGWYEMVEHLVKLGADVNARNNKRRTPLHAYFSDLRTPELLIAHGASLHAKCSRGWYPIHYACDARNLDLLQLYISHGASRSLCNIEAIKKRKKKPRPRATITLTPRSHRSSKN